ncbi:MAG: NAD(P)-dependent glycerol-3-phosphate dehydrogenase [Hyphomicrobiales bacterium]|nr:NAD(P)-dependent glycerol-3-phosphate dehydrogenase [Hyphomicrobiales bacterium]MCP4997298.1 NAD(P)-dependent glycerol-3-phosphate dehydrogenase [Hyphomicrobiales bacterium]
MSAKIAVLGAGAFGTALAVVAASEGDPVTLVGRDAGRMKVIEKNRVSETVLPGVELPASLAVTADTDALSTADIVLLGVPAQSLRTALQTYGNAIGNVTSLVVCAKGIEQSSGLFLADVVEAVLPDHPTAILSGPGFAADIARGLPTAMTIASARKGVAEELARHISSGTFRLYASDDVVGVETGGALKNVLAIACGIVEGRGLGESARAALIARGLAELMRFAKAHGGAARTVSGLSGLGDLVLTATSHQSRNLRFGLALGKGTPLDELMAPDAPLSEGAFTASVAASISAEKNIEMPITQAVAAILRGKLGIKEAVDALMTRPLKSE